MADSKEKSRVKKDGAEGNVHAIPRIDKVIINVGIGKHRDDSGYREAVVKDIMSIAGQRPHECKAKKSVAGFNVRKGNVIGYRVTLRGRRKEDFISRFIGMTLPRVRDFRGIPVSAFDDQGNLNVGIEEQLSFPEIRVDKTEIIFGVQVTFVTTAGNDKDGEVLFRKLGFPLEGGE